MEFANSYESLDYNYILEEFVANCLEGFFDTEEGATQFLNWLTNESGYTAKQKKGIVRTILDAIDRFIESIKELIRTGTLSSRAAIDAAEAKKEEAQKFRKQFLEALRTPSVSSADSSPKGAEIVGASDESSFVMELTDEEAAEIFGEEFDDEPEFVRGESRYAQRKRAEENVEDLDDDIFPWIDDDEGIKWSKKISLGMSEEERFNALSDRSFKAASYHSQAESFILKNKNDLESRKRSLLKDAFRKAVVEFSVPNSAFNADQIIDIQISFGTFDETAQKGIARSEDIVRLMPVIEEVIKNAVGIEIHDSRYYADTNTAYFANLLGGYVDGKDFVPIRFGVKAQKGGNNSLYVIIDDERIKKSEVIMPASHHNSDENTGARSDYKVSIAKLAKKVKSKDVIKYLPDKLLSDNQ